jgi:hypothetical protein
LIESDGGSGFTVIQGSRRIELTITEDEVSLHCPPVREE